MIARNPDFEPEKQSESERKEMLPRGEIQRERWMRQQAWIKGGVWSEEFDGQVDFVWPNEFGGE